MDRILINRSDSGEAHKNKEKKESGPKIIKRFMKILEISRSIMIKKDPDRNLSIN